MLIAVRTYRSSLWLGLALTAVLTAVTLYFELRETHQSGSARINMQIDNAEQRLSMAAAELQAAAAFVEQSDPRIKQFEAFIDKLPLSNQRRVPWAWAEAVDANAISEIEQQVRLETGDQSYAVKTAQASGGIVVPVVASFGSDFTVPAGRDLSELPEVTAVVRDAGSRDTSFNPLFSIAQGALSTDRLFLGLYVTPKARGGERPPPAAVIIRGTNLAALSAAAGLDQDQHIRVIDLSGGQERLLLGPAAADDSYSWTAVSPVNVSPFKLGIAISQPKALPLPTLWLIPLLIGTLATLTYVAFRAGLLIRLQANAAIAQLAGTEKRLFAARERESLFFEHSGTANCEVNYPSGTITRVNEAFCRLFEYTEEELLGRSLIDMTHPEDRLSSAEARLREDGTLKPEVQMEKRYLRKDGSAIWAVVNATLNTDPITGEHSYLAVIVDITARKNDEETRTLLLRELAHRVRNTVQLTASLARQTARTARSVKEYDSKFHLRLAALTAAHDLLFEQNWRSASLVRIVNRSLKPLLPENTAVCPVTVNLPDIELSTQQAQTLAIAIQELAGNSVQYGALRHGGDIVVDGAVDVDPETDKRTLRISWRENSRKRFRKPHKAGFGTIMLVTVLPEQFGGTAELSWRSSGLTYSAILPLA